MVDTRHYSVLVKCFGPTNRTIRLPQPLKIFDIHTYVKYTKVYYYYFTFNRKDDSEQ